MSGEAREIKFRAWDKREKILVYDNENNSTDYWDGVMASEIGLLNSLLDNKEYILMQYTGLKDYHKKEIYEGDIVRFLETSGYDFEEIVENMWDIRDHCWDKNVDYEDIKVIGNIYENKELLNK